MGDLSHLLCWGLVATMALQRTHLLYHSCLAQANQALHSNAAPQDRFEVDLELVTVAGTE